MPIEIKLSEEDKEDIASRVAKKISDCAEFCVNNEVKTTFSVKEVSKILGNNKVTVINHIKNGLLTAKKNGKNYIITQESLDKYLTK